MNPRMLACMLAVPFAALTVAAPATAAPPADRPMPGKSQGAAKSQGAEVYQVRLTELNDSGVTGKAVLVLKDGTLRVNLHARDLVPNMLHLQHVHGFEGDKNATCPPPSATGGDGVLGFLDGLPFYGPVLLPLTPFPMADNGKINYHQTFEVDGDLADLSDETIVLHGGFVDGVYQETLPVACGEID